MQVATWLPARRVPEMTPPVARDRTPSGSAIPHPSVVQGRRHAGPKGPTAGLLGPCGPEGPRGGRREGRADHRYRVDGPDSESQCLFTASPIQGRGPRPHKHRIDDARAFQRLICSSFVTGHDGLSSRLVAWRLAPGTQVVIAPPGDPAGSRARAFFIPVTRNRGDAVPRRPSGATFSARRALSLAGRGAPGPISGSRERVTAARARLDRFQLPSASVGFPGARVRPGLFAAQI